MVPSMPSRKVGRVALAGLLACPFCGFWGMAEVWSIVKLWQIVKAQSGYSVASDPTHIETR